MNWDDYKKTLSRRERLKYWWIEFKLTVWRDWIKRCPKCHHKVSWDWEVESDDFGGVLAKYKYHICSEYMAGCKKCQYGECDEELNY
ncbi:hypothetical protein LCGC14_2919930 [marine sediment metagenome]|uniref:Uncharacterized protein n=1 Tax=marine sediment metagenome TaxID=412755 RepID=A0A0F8YAZ4_9ZZZZ